MKKTLLLLIIVNSLEGLHILSRNLLSPILSNTYSNNFHWGLISYFNNYSIDFYRRSIIGSIISLLNFPPTLSNLIILKFAFLSIFTILFFLLCKKLRWSDFLIILLSPFFIQMFVFSSLAVSDLTTFIFFTSCLILIKTSKRNLIFLLIPIGILNHMIFSIIFCPLLIFFVYQKKNITFTIFTILSWLIPSFFVIVYGNFDLSNIEALESVIINNDFVTDEHSFYFVENTNSIIDNIKFSLSYFNYALNNNVRALCFGLLIILMAIFLFLNRIALKKIITPFLILTSSIFGMFLIGFDYPRWIGYYISTLLIIMIYSDKLIFNKNLKIFFAVMILLGPIGTSDPFPLFFKLYELFIL